MLCQRWGVGPTHLLEGEDAGYLLAMLKVINPEAKSDDAMLLDLMERAEVGV